MATDLDRVLAGLAEPTRRRIVDHLRRGPRRAGQLAEACGTSMPAMSRHLRVLRRCGLVEGGGLEHDARVRLYRLRPEPLAALRAWLQHVEAFWSGQLAAFKTHAESTRRQRGKP
jgi:DNA-binding transcriptional ArsR family regulator